MVKEVQNESCDYCESIYRLVYDVELTNGFAKFCPFCGEDVGEKNDEEFEDDQDQ